MFNTYLVKPEKAIFVQIHKAKTAKAALVGAMDSMREEKICNLITQEKALFSLEKMGFTKIKITDYPGVYLCQ